MDQPTFAKLEFQGKKLKTRRELFLEPMDDLVHRDGLEPVLGTNQLTIIVDGRRS